MRRALLSELRQYAATMADLEHEDAAHLVDWAADEIESLRERVKYLESERVAVAKILGGCEPVAIPVPGELEKLASGLVNELKEWVAAAAIARLREAEKVQAHQASGMSFDQALDEEMTREWSE